MRYNSHQHSNAQPNVGEVWIISVRTMDDGSSVSRIPCVITSVEGDDLTFLRCCKEYSLKSERHLIYDLLPTGLESQIYIDRVKNKGKRSELVNKIGKLSKRDLRYVK